MFSHVASHARLYQALLGADGSAQVINHLLQRMTVTAHANLERVRTGRSPDRGSPDAAEAGIPADPQAVFIAGAVLATVIDWLRRDLPGTAAQMAAVIRPSLASVAATALPEPPAADQLAADELAARKLA